MTFVLAFNNHSPAQIAISYKFSKFCSYCMTYDKFRKSIWRWRKIASLLKHDAIVEVTFFILFDLFGFLIMLFIKPRTWSSFEVFYRRFAVTKSQNVASPLPECIWKMNVLLLSAPILNPPNSTNERSFQAKLVCTNQTISLIREYFLFCAPIVREGISLFVNEVLSACRLKAKMSASLEG